MLRNSSLTIFRSLKTQLSSTLAASRFYSTSTNEDVEGLKITTSNHVCRIEFSRPWKYNAITSDMYIKIPKVLKEASANDEVKFVVFAGTGAYYCSGNDLSNFDKAAKIGKEAMAKEAQEILHKFVGAFIDFDKPLIACVNGPAVGIGVSTLPLFDIVWASDTATFNTPFVSLGQACEGASTYTFPYLMGHSKASEFLLFGRKLSAQEAYERNLVNEVIPDSKFFDECNRRIAEYSKLPPQALKINKQILRRFHLESLHKANEHECAVLKERWVSKECEKALIAFMTRKKNRYPQCYYHLFDGDGKIIIHSAIAKTVVTDVVGSAIPLIGRIIIRENQTLMKEGIPYSPSNSCLYSSANFGKNQISKNQFCCTEFEHA